MSLHKNDKKAKRPQARSSERPFRPGPTGPLPQAEAGFTDETAHVSKDSRLRKVLLVMLPLVAVLLSAVLGYLIYRMPESAEIKLQPMRETPPSTDTLLRTEPLPSATIAEPVRIEPVVIRSNRISSLRISRLIQVGAGIQPGKTQEVPELIYKQGDTVPTWPGVKAADIQESTAMPAESAAFAAVSETLAESAAPAAESETLPESTETAAENETQAAPEETPPVDATIPDALTAEATAAAENLPESPLMQHSANDGFTPSGMTAYVYGNIVNVRSDFDTNSEILAEVYAGEVVQELMTNGSWSLVRLADGMEGYIYSNLLSYNYVAPEEEVYVPKTDMVLEDDFVPYFGTLYASNSNVNIRSGPSLNSEVISTMYYGDWVTATGYTGGWFQIEWYNGEVAYVHGDYLQEEPVAQEELTGEVIHEDVAIIAAPPPPVDPGALAGGSAVVNTALQYVGSPYVFGASGPNAFDCSGFTSYIFGLLGAPISRTTYTQVNDGIPVPFSYRDYSNLIPGDLLLFAEGTDVFHAGIYIGGGQMVHAGNASTGVVVDDLNLEFYASRLAYVRRIFY